MIGKAIIGIIIVVMLVATGLFFGIIPGLDILDSGTTTLNGSIGGIHGHGELIGPLDRKGFIMSYKADGLSETIVVQGSLTTDSLFTAAIDKYVYTVYGKKDTASDWEVLSDSTSTSRYISNPNPKALPETSGSTTGGTYYLKSYPFSLVGNTYHAIKVILQVHIDPNIANPFDGNYVWKTLQTDEAYIYEGWGGLYLPKDANGTARSTFEIGETVNIGVKTTYGGYTVGTNNNTWRVAMIRPADQGGAELKHQDYGDNANAYFTFTVTQDMVKLDGTSNNRYIIEIYNTLVPQGTLSVNTIDFLAKAPSDVTFSGGEIQYKVGDTVKITLSATRNTQTQLPIKSFEVSVWYGSHDVLMPSDPTSAEWIVNTVDIPATTVDGHTYTATVSFTTKKESFVTLLSKAYDSVGRASIHTEYYTMWMYAGNPVPKDVINDQTGGGTYAGGHTNFWTPWEPTGNWGATGISVDWWGIALCIFIIVALAIVGFLFFKDPRIMFIFIIIGIVISIIIYVMFFVHVF